MELYIHYPFLLNYSPSKLDNVVYIAIWWKLNNPFASLHVIFHLVLNVEMIVQLYTERKKKGKRKIVIQLHP